jgi:hypothetical protein
MARIPLQFLGWAYDEETKRIIARFQDIARSDDPDPISHVPSIELEVELLPRKVDETEVEQPEQLQIDELHNVVDQLVLDNLMNSMEGLI